KRLPRNVGMGAFRAILHTVETTDDAFATGGQFLIDAADRAREKNDGEDAEPVSFEAAPPLRTLFPGVFEAAHDFANEVEPNNTVADDITQGIAQSMIPFSGYLKAFGGLKHVS